MRGVSTSTKELINQARQILVEDHPQTLRQIHYRIFSMGVMTYANDKASYRGLCRVLTNARRLHRQWELSGAEGDSPALGLPSNWIVDELRQGEQVNVWKDAQGYIEAVKTSYRRDNWRDQQHYVELWGEKATVLGSLRKISEEWGLMLRVCRGFGSAGMEDQVGRLFEAVTKPITVFYVGDHDASGVLIERDMHRRVQTASGMHFRMLRMAIHAEDIVRFKLPPQEIKERDVRASAFRREFGAEATTVELEALPVPELKRRLVRAITSLIDFDRWNHQVSVQQVELNCIAEFADRMKNLPQLAGAA